MSTHPLMARQLKRLLGSPGGESLSATLDELRDFLERHEASPTLHRLATGLPDFFHRVDRTYAQFDRDLELRSRSLELSSRELQGINEELREALDIREQAITRLHVVAQRLQGSASETCATDVADAEKLPRLVSQISDLVDRQAVYQTQMRALHVDLGNQKFALDQHAIVSITDLQGTITYANDRFCEISGYSRDELVGANHNIVNSGHHPAAVFAELWQTISAGKVWRGEIKNRKKNGGYYWASATIVPLMNVDGIPERYIGIRTDITERKAVEEQLAEQLHFIEVLIETIPLPIFLKDTEGRYLRFNAACETLMGIERSEWIGRTVSDLLSSEMVEVMRAGEQALFATGKVQTFDVVFTNSRTGKLHTAAGWKARLTRPDGSVAGLVGAVLDMTERKNFERELQAAKLAAEAANQAKSDFLANMSHEIRTPMNGILGMTDLALDTELNPTQRDYLNIVKNSAESLLVILNDILDFSKIEAGKLSVETISFNLPVTITECLKSIAARATRKGVNLVCDLPPDLPNQVEGDPGRIRQVLTNLCDNAIKFTRQGHIAVRVRCLAEDAGICEIQLSVSDTGIGIAADKLDRIFEAFTQADASTTRHFGGTGLGLAISTSLVELMGGRIRVESEEGQGSTFHFTVSLRRVAEANVNIPPLTIWSGIEALIVDDHPVNRQSLGHWLRAWGFNVAEAVDGAQALRMCRAGEAGTMPYRVIVLDANLPGIDGFSFVQTLRDEERLGETRLIMLSSGGGKGDARRCRESGISAYLTKPATPMELRETLTRVLDDVRLDAAPTLLTRHELKEQRRSLSVLLVEDHPVNQKLATTLLEKWGHRVALAQNGREAVAMFQTTAFDIVLMDMQMPVMGGIEATRLIRRYEADSGVATTPVWAMTANAMESDLQRCLDAGMDGYMSKPIKGADLERALMQLSVLKGVVLTPAAVALTPGVIAAIDAAIATVDQELIEMVGAVFIEQIPADIEALRTAFSAGDFVQVKRHAHNIKGALKMFALDELASILMEIELAPESCGKNLDFIDRAAYQVVGSVRKYLPVTGEKKS